METQFWETNWHKKEPLGRGGQGLTYLVEDRRTPGAKAVLKLLKNNRDQQARGRMRREVAALETLSSSGCAVPRVLEHNTGEFENPSTVLYLVMEFISGDTLAALVEKQPLSVENAVALIQNLAKVMEEAFRQNILHRDLKPDNIIVRDMTLCDSVIIDYGLSFNADDEEGTITRPGETLRNKFLDLPETNTPGGDMRDKRSDITALCAIFYFCLTGHRPGHLQDSAGRLPHLRPGYSIAERLNDDRRTRAIEMLFSCGLNPHLDARFQTVDEFLTRLNNATGSRQASATEDPVAVAKRASERLRAVDRTTQLRDFKAIAHLVTQAILQYCGQLNGKLGRFMLSNVGVSTPPVPIGLDEVPDIGVHFLVAAQHHEVYRWVMYKVASKGEQCVLLRSTKMRAKGSHADVDQTPWNEVFWFDGNMTPDTAPAVDDFKAWIGTAVEEVQQEIAR